MPAGPGGSRVYDPAAYAELRGRFFPPASLPPADLTALEQLGHFGQHGDEPPGLMMPLHETELIVTGLCRKRCSDSDTCKGYQESRWDWEGAKTGWKAQAPLQRRCYLFYVTPYLTPMANDTALEGVSGLVSIEDVQASATAGTVEATYGSGALSELGDFYAKRGPTGASWLYAKNKHARFARTGGVGRPSWQVSAASGRNLNGVY